ncbi:Wzz/FepE/Etk N-terminal domain-containing protein, partial [Aeromicrobium endophyticum]|uniref:Wzz/FepE/Etk N-terminal domain-containing protein n=2 Tax=Aeromicrobium endophyticum TaxID=2292704 RepID=UPI0018F418F3
MEPLTLTELIARLACRWRVLAAGALVGLAAGVSAHLLLPERYEATAVVFVDAADPSRVDMTAEAAVASSRRVSAEAVDALGDRHVSVTTLEDAASATTVSESRLLRLTYSASAPRAAARGADAVAQADSAHREGGPQ